MPDHALQFLTAQPVEQAAGDADCRAGRVHAGRKGIECGGLDDIDAGFDDPGRNGHLLHHVVQLRFILHRDLVCPRQPHHDPVALAKGNH